MKRSGWREGRNGTYITEEIDQINSEFKSGGKNLALLFFLWSAGEDLLGRFWGRRSSAAAAVAAAAAAAIGIKKEKRGKIWEISLFLSLEFLGSKGRTDAPLSLSLSLSLPPSVLVFRPKLRIFEWETGAKFPRTDGVTSYSGRLQSHDLFNVSHFLNPSFIFLR
ncbi:hypothetical protein ACLOJK_035535 [Asimina triloba]